MCPQVAEAQAERQHHEPTYRDVATYLAAHAVPPQRQAKIAVDLRQFTAARGEVVLPPCRRRDLTQRVLVHSATAARPERTARPTHADREDRHVDVARLLSHVHRRRAAAVLPIGK